jgi:uncharacterized protein YfcZ (UPF0381/DUF406 family)
MENEYQKSIAQWRKSEHNLRLWVARLIKTIQQRRQVQSKELELFRDQFEFETGLDSHKEGAAAFESACRVHIQRAQVKQQRRLEAEERAGTIAEFDDFGPMEDLGGDAEFAAEILKQHPEFKR